MFDANKGDRLFNDLYVYIIERNDVSQWFPRSTGSEYGSEWADAARPWLAEASAEDACALVALIARMLGDSDVLPVLISRAVSNGNDLATVLGFELGCYHENRLTDNELHFRSGTED